MKKQSKSKIKYEKTNAYVPRRFVGSDLEVALSNEIDEVAFQDRVTKRQVIESALRLLFKKRGLSEL